MTQPLPLRTIEHNLHALADELRPHLAGLDPNRSNDIERQHKWLAGIVSNLREAAIELDEYRAAYGLEPLQPRVENTHA